MKHFLPQRRRDAEKGKQPEVTLTIRIHRMACPAHDKAISSLLADLTKAASVIPA